MRISDWSSDVCSSDLSGNPGRSSIVLPIILRRVAGSLRYSRLSVVSTSSGCTALTRPWYSANSQPATLLTIRTAAFDAEYTESVDMIPFIPHADATCHLQPPTPSIPRTTPRHPRHKPHTPT